MMRIGIDRLWWGVLAGAAAGAAATLLVTSVIQPQASGPGPEPGMLVIISGEDLSNQRQAMIDLWNARGDRPQASIISVKGGATAQRSEMVARAQSNDRDIDIFNLDVTMMTEFQQFGYLRPLDESRLDLTGFLDKPLATCRDSSGRLWGLPFNTDAALLFYRTDLVDKEHPPTNWQTLTASAQQALQKTQNTPAPLAGGYTGQLQLFYEGLTVNALEMVWAAGGQAVDDAGNVVIDEATQEGLRRLARGLKQQPHLILPDAINQKEDESTQAFRDGKVAFLRSWPVAYQRLTSPASESGSTTTVPFAITRLPWPSVLGGQNLAISAHSDQPRAAQELIDFLTSPHIQQMLFERGGFAATREIIYKDRDKKFRDNYPYIDDLLDAVKSARLRPRTAYYAAFSEEFRAGVRWALEHDGQLPSDFSSRVANALKGLKP